MELMNPSLSRRERAQICSEAGSAFFAQGKFAEARAEYEQAIAQVTLKRRIGN